MSDKVGKVHQGMLNILKHLQVDANGMLPGNMGGKPYITAQDISNEVKSQLVENSLVFYSNEELVSEEHLIHKDRVVVRIVTRGEYTFVSAEDGSSATISGVGDGLAVGTAVSSNIASTNALKNALLRTFHISEKSVEEQAMSGPAEPKQTPAERRVQQASKANPVTKKDGPRALIKKEFLDENVHTRDEVNALVEVVKKDGLSGDKLYEEVLNRLRA